MGGARAVRFDASLRTAHGGGCFCCVQFLPITQQEGFALTCGKLSYRFFDHRNQLGLGKCILRLGWLAVVFLILQGIERVKVLAFVLRRERRHQRGPERAYFLAAVIIADRVLQDALEQHGEFFRRMLAVALGELHHGVLHDIQRRMLVAYGELRLFVGATFHLGEEFGKLLWRGQFRWLRGERGGY